MRARLVIMMIGLVGTIGAAGAEPMDWLQKEQKVAVGQLIGGYTEALICKKNVDLEVAGKFLQEKLGDAKITPDQLAQAFHMALGLHGLQMGEFMKSRPTEQTANAHCKKVYDEAFGPKGHVIPGLMK